MFHIPIGVVADGEVVLCAGFGRRVGRDLPVTAETLFPIAASTKTFTAALCAALVDEGRLSWQRPVRDYLPGFQMSDPVASSSLTVYDMLSHRSGLPRHDLLWYAAAGLVELAELLAALRHLGANKGFREVWQYNNLMYTMAGELAGQVAGALYEQAMRERILQPLG